MKKIIALLLLAIMCLSFVACGNKTEKEIVGKWESSNGNYSFTFNEDGTGTTESNGQIRWKYDSELASYIVCEPSGQMFCINNIQTDENGARYFQYSVIKLYYKNN